MAEPSPLLFDMIELCRIVKSQATKLRWMRSTKTQMAMYTTARHMRTYDGRVLFEPCC